MYGVSAFQETAITLLQPSYLRKSVGHQGCKSLGSQG